MASHCKTCVNFIVPGDSQKIGLTNYDLEFEIEKSDGITFFFFDADTVEGLEWSEVRAKVLILDSHTYSLRELKQSDWKVNYPVN